MRRKPKTSKDKRFEKYQSPLAERYASEEMSYNFSDKLKYSTWRKLWIALAETQRSLGVKTITKKQIEEIQAERFSKNIDIASKRFANSIIKQSKLKVSVFKRIDLEKSIASRIRNSLSDKKVITIKLAVREGRKILKGNHQGFLLKSELRARTTHQLLNNEVQRRSER
ncbi:hypothetical protein LCGC14_1465890 [marine sediment metagenome]|uniref:Fumarate lyase N-terminal domain-containing protein n=1 Tax=marine sediment metagenome TaxID=412755 RepID=A0A0F9JDS7_9ZZZZ